MVADPLTRYDCVPVVAGAQAIIIAHPIAFRKDARRCACAPSATASITTIRKVTACRPASAPLPTSFGKAADAKPSDIDVASIYDDYPAMVLAQLNDLGMIPTTTWRPSRARHRRAAHAHQYVGRHDVGGQPAVRPAVSNGISKPCCSFSIGPATAR